jgi:hypothetical protein
MGNIVTKHCEEGGEEEKEDKEEEKRKKTKVFNVAKKLPKFRVT